MRKALWALGASLLVVLWVAAGSSKTAGEESVVVYGFDVDIGADEEFEDLVHCEISMFALDTEEVIGQLPGLRISSGDSNSMVITGADGVEVTFTCGVNAAMTEVSYEIAGRKNNRLVINQLATVRL